MQINPFVHLQMAALRTAELQEAAAAHRLASTRRARPAWLDRRAVTDVLPVLLGVAPLGVVIGVTAHQASLSAWAGAATAFLMFSGSANLTALTLAGSGTAMLAVLGTVAVLNARLAVYGAGLEPWFRHQPGWFRWLAPHLINDQTYLLATARDDLRDPSRFRRYWLTVGVALGGGWCAAVAAGAALGPVLPAQSPLAVAAPACLVALLVPRLRDRPGALAALVAGAVAVPAGGLPVGTGIPLAVAAGLAAGALADRKAARR